MQPTNCIEPGCRVSGVDDCGVEFLATVIETHVSSKTSREVATLKRDDGKIGTGKHIADSPYDGKRGYLIRKKRNGLWGSDGSHGKLYLSDNDGDGDGDGDGDNGNGDNAIEDVIDILENIDIDNVGSSIEEAIGKLEGMMD